MQKRQLLHIFVFLFVAATGAAFFAMNYQPEPARANLLTRVHAMPMTNRYVDLKIALAGLECDRRGIDVYLDNPCVREQLGIRFGFNYPRTFLWLGRLIPLSVKDGDWLGPLLDVAFLLAVASLFRGERFGQALCFCALVASPPVLLSLERANVDIAIFCGILLAVNCVGQWSEAAGWAMSFALGTLKIYPVAAVAGLIRNTRKSRGLFWLTVAAEGIFAALLLSNLRMVKAMTPQEDFNSYGYPVLFLILSKSFGSLFWMRLAWPALFAACTWIAYAGLRTRRFWIGMADAGDAKLRPLFVAGGAIYAVSFVLGTNYDYRSIFLLFTVPYLFSLRGGSPVHRRIASLAPGTIAAAFWLTGIPTGFAATFSQALLTWVLFLFFGPLAVAVTAEALLPGTAEPPQPAPV